jgi:GAF domain-containing protein
MSNSQPNGRTQPADASPQNPTQEPIEHLLIRLIAGQTIAVGLLTINMALGGFIVDPGLFSTLPLGGIAIVVGIVAYWLLRRGHSRLGGYTFFLGTIVAITMILVLRGYHDVSVMFYLWPILGAMLLMSVQAGLVMGAAAGLLYLAVIAIQLLGYQTPPLPYDYQKQIAIGVGSTLVIFTMLAFLAWLVSRNLRRAIAQANQLAQGLQELNATLEDRVEERTAVLTQRARYMEATAEVARSTTSMLDVQELLTRVVSLVSERFGFYHTGIFLLDPVKEWAVLQAASSEGGQRMLARNHRLRVGAEGIVGYVTGQGQPRIALDVGVDAVYFDNPDLPETRSEMALPLLARGEIIGALDVQSTEPGAFGDEDAAVLQTLADQVAMAISNAQLFEHAQESLETARRAYGDVSRRAWIDLLKDRTDWGFRYANAAIAPTEGAWQDPMLQAAKLGQAVTGSGADAPTLALPLKVRDQVIGVLSLRKKQADGRWTADEITLLENLTEQLSMALESARLYQDTQRRATRERLIGQVTARMRETLDMEAVLQTAVDEMYQALGLDKVVVRLRADGAGDS